MVFLQRNHVEKSVRRDIDISIHQLTVAASRAHAQNIQQVIQTAPFMEFAREYGLNKEEARVLATEIVRRQASGEDIATYLNDHAKFLRARQEHGKDRRRNHRR